MKFASTHILVVLVAIMANAAYAAELKSIFDDDWVPPKRSETPRPAPIKPTTTPEANPSKPIDPPVNPPNNPTPPTPAAPAVRNAIPGKPEQAAVRKVLKEAFADQLVDRSVSARRKLAEALLAQAEKSAKLPVEQFVLLAAAIDAGLEAVNLPLAFQAGDRMAETFDVDALALKTETAGKLVPKPGAAEVAAENFKVGLPLADELIANSEFTAAARVCAALLPLASNNPALRAEVLSRQRDLSAAREAFEKVSRHMEKLKTAPEDPAANLEVGKYLCFQKSDWKSGLPALSRGSDAKLKTMALSELAGAETADAQAAIGDGWWELAQASTGRARTSVQSHALEWYAKAVRDLQGLTKVKVEKRLASAEASASSSGSARPADVPQPPLRREPTATERESLRAEYKSLVAKAGAETNAAKRDNLLIDSAAITIKLGDARAAFAELDRIVRQNGKADNSSVGANALFLKGTSLSQMGQWKNAEGCFMQICKEYPGSYGNRGCEAGNLIAQHYEALGRMDAVVAAKLLVVECSGSYGDGGGEACLWLADYYLGRKDKESALKYLREAIAKHPGHYDKWKKKAQDKMREIEAK